MHAVHSDQGVFVARKRVSSRFHCDHFWSRTDTSFSIPTYFLSSPRRGHHGSQCLRPMSERPGRYAGRFIQSVLGRSAPITT